MTGSVRHEEYQGFFLVEQGMQLPIGVQRLNKVRSVNTQEKLDASFLAGVGQCYRFTF